MRHPEDLNKHGRLMWITAYSTFFVEQAREEVRTGGLLDHEWEAQAARHACKVADLAVDSFIRLEEEGGR